jgi:glycogen debranching enzyme
MELRTRPHQRFTYHHRSLLVTNPLGLIPGDGTEGFYFHNTRLLSRLQWSIDGHHLEPFAVTEVAHAAVLGYAEVPETKQTKQHEVFVEVSAAHVELAAFVGDGLRLRAAVANYDDRDCHVGLGLDVGADFTGTGEADSGARELSAGVTTTWEEDAGSLEFRLDSGELERAVRIEVESGPKPTWNGATLCFGVHVPARGRSVVEVLVVPVFDGHAHRPPRGQFAVGPVATTAAARLGEEPPQLETSNDTVARAWRTAVEDLASLTLGLPEGPATPIAGTPLYDQFFGRDALTTGWQALLALRAPLRDALRVNAALQGGRIDDWRDEEPGKMIHQAGDAPASVAGRNPFDRYYGDYATPVDFVAMVGQYYAWTGDTQTALSLLPAARKALTWLDRYGDLDRDGLLEYRKRSEKGVRNQGWKDAPNAIVDEHGTIQNDPTVASELQGYWYAALRAIAPVFAAAGDRVHARRLLAQAHRLRQRVNARLWLADEGTYALGIGPDGAVLKTIASNAGHLLLTAVATPEQGRAVAHRLMAPDMFSGWGIRTMSADHPAYNPFSYHLGSVWPVEQATIAAGFGRYGCYEELHRLAGGFFDMSELFVANRIPESVGGLPRDGDHPHPGVYPKANVPQAWSASAVVMMVQAVLGLRPFAPAHVLLVDPQLPPWLPELTLRDIRVGRAYVDLEVWRTHDGRTKWRSRVRSGHLLVIQRPSVRAGRSPVARLLERAVSR